MCETYSLTCTFVLTQIPKLEIYIKDHIYIYIYYLFLTNQLLFIKRVKP